MIIATHIDEMNVEPEVEFATEPEPVEPQVNPQDRPLSILLLLLKLHNLFMLLKMHVYVCRPMTYHTHLLFISIP